MTGNRASVLCALLVLLGGAAMPRPTEAADDGAGMRSARGREAEFADRWEFDFRPYAWAPFITGDATLGKHTASIDTSLIDIAEKADQIYAWMSYQELRKGRFGLFADLFWARTNLVGSAVKERMLIPGLDVTAVVDADVWADVTIAEPGIAYEIANWSRGAATSVDPDGFEARTAVDVLAGARYWRIDSDIRLNVSAAIDIPALGLKGASGTVSAATGIDWWDPFIGLRLRHDFAPGQDLTLRADIGGFGLGSNISWQAVAGYSRTFHIHGRPLTAYLGYRALYVDYDQGIGDRKIGFATLWHGPILGLTFKW